MPAYWLFTHGLGCVIEDLDAPGLQVRRQSSGLYVQQNSGTSNWFHFTIPTITADKDSRYQVATAILTYERLQADPQLPPDLQANAVPVALRVFDIDYMIEEFVFDKKPGRFGNGTRIWSLTNAHELNQGVLLSLFVRWDASGDASPCVWFRSAGVTLANDINAVTGGA
jgi:hypothetical protein